MPICSPRKRTDPQGAAFRSRTASRSISHIDQLWNRDRFDQAEPHRRQRLCCRARRSQSFLPRILYEVVSGRKSFAISNW